MSKEKLAKIKNKVEKNYKVSKQVARLFKDNSDAKDLSCWIDYKSINYLIKQAERSIDYDNKLISIEDNKQYVSELLEQNKRYREELDVIGEVINSVDDADEINDRILKSMEEDE